MPALHGVTYWIYQIDGLYNYIHVPTMTCRVLSEVDLVLGTKTYVDSEDLQKLEYMEQVIECALLIQYHSGLWLHLS